MNRVASYSIGLVLALILTVAAFALVFAHSNGGAAILSRPLVIGAVLVLAMVQLAVQLVFFLHLGRGKDARWNRMAFFVTFFGILVVVLASVWIMNHLNYNMTPTEINEYVNDQSSF